MVASFVLLSGCVVFNNPQACICISYLQAPGRNLSSMSVELHVHVAPKSAPVRTKFLPCISALTPVDLIVAVTTGLETVPVIVTSLTYLPLVIALSEAILGNVPWSEIHSARGVLTPEDSVM